MCRDRATGWTLSRGAGGEQQESRSTVRHCVPLSPGAVIQMWGKSATGIRKETLSSPSAQVLTAPHTQGTPWS